MKSLSSVIPVNAGIQSRTLARVMAELILDSQNHLLYHIGKEYIISKEVYHGCNGENNFQGTDNPA